MSDLTFDAEKHEYRLNGVVVPYVTQIIGTVLPGWKAGEFYLQRGAATHHGCRLLDEGRLDRSSVDPEIEPRIKAWESFRAQYACEVVAIEKPLAHEDYRFAGTLDRILKSGKELIVVDLKNSISPQVRLQLGAYSLLWQFAGNQCHRAAAVELRDDGDYRCLWLSPTELRKAERRFLATLTVFNFMKEHNLKGNDQ